MADSRVHKFVVVVALTLLACIAFESNEGPTSHALTGGPSQPEVQSFEPIETSDMVDLFTGDFTYNIPLFELPGPNGGYPFNVAYHSGITMDEEASWVGLGWNLNAGVINRQIMGLPDDFDGDEISRKQDIRDNVTIGVGVGANIELFGGDTDKGFPLSLGVGIKLYYNNYKGVGYSLDPGLDFHPTTKSGLTAGLGLGLSLDSQEGFGVSPSLSLSREIQNTEDKYLGEANVSIGVGYNSRRGLTDLSAGLSTSKRTDMIEKNYRRNTLTMKDRYYSTGGTSRLSFANTSYSPSVGMEMTGRNLSVVFKPGGVAYGVFGNFAFSGFFNTQYLAKKDQTVTDSAYGYLNLHNASSREDVLLDFNREKDGVIRKTSPNLASPRLTYDVYSVVGQGVGSMYRPYRSDIGIVHDQQIKSEYAGGAFGVDVGPGAGFHLGLNASVNYANQEARKWTENNGIEGMYDFHCVTGTDSADYEPFYFKTYGEQTGDSLGSYDYIPGGEEAVRIKLGSDKSEGRAENQLETRSGAVVLPADDGHRKERKPRNLSILPFTNRQLNDSAQYGLGEYDVRYYTVLNDYDQDPPWPIDRMTRSEKPIANHIGGYTAVNPNGSRYVYGLPAYNLEQVECQFSVDGSSVNNCGPTVAQSPVNYKAHDDTDKYFNWTEMPPYAHSYLLTSILGRDYVDLNGNGPDDADFGYWVRFDYVRAQADYKWRVPFRGASYLDGYKSTRADDKGSYIYGRKEIWYLAAARTKSHIAVFYISPSISPRGDSRGAIDEELNQFGIGAATSRLDSIKLYTRSEYGTNAVNAVPVKSTHFRYSYALCRGVPNQASYPDSGKLTLKKLFFTYQKNRRGELSPYEFDYHEGVGAENPNYDTHAYDRWGRYKPTSPANRCFNLDFPYVDQDPNEPGRHTNAAVWSLKEIALPSGGRIAIDYESDDYGYVQNKPAMQMFMIHSFMPGPDTINVIVHPPSAGAPARGIFFELEEPIPGTATEEEKSAVFAKYMEGLRVVDGVDTTYQLYYKVKIQLKKPSDGVSEYVAGYADVDIDASGIDDLHGAETEYLRGYVTLKETVIGKKTVPYHPISHAAWQHLRTNMPDQIVRAGSINPNAKTKKDKQSQVIKMFNLFDEVLSTFKSLNKHAYDREWGREVNLSRSWIRLTSPDKIKYGGNVRVRKITFNDNWQTMTGGAESSADYGQVYDYVTTDEYGDTISSGVAEYEPLIGGDEIALRWAKNYPGKQRWKSDNALYFEFPINESYYPAASVGYSKVTVKSLATQRVLDGTLVGAPTTGVSVHEFYTAKDYPVVATETNPQMLPYYLFVPVPLLGEITIDNLTASQGYAIELNDMHGRLKSVTNFAQDAGGRIINAPVSGMRHYYKHTERKHDGYSVLDNRVPVLLSDLQLDRGNPKLFPDGFYHSAIDTNYQLAVDIEFFTDMRESRAASFDGGLSLNAVITPFPPFGFTCPWPNVSKSINRVRTAVTNKIIHKSGILIKTEAFDGQSRVVTDNLLFDALTGGPLLTSVNNNFDSLVYSYETPAHWEYDAMGPASQNSGLVLDEVTLWQSRDDEGYYLAVNLTAEQKTLLVPGDEFLVDGVRIVFKGINTGGTAVFSKLTTSADVTPGPEKTLLLVRSGRRNLLTTNLSKTVALQNPTIRKSIDTVSKSVLIPDGLIGYLNAKIDSTGRLGTGVDTLAYITEFPVLASMFKTIELGTARQGTKNCGTPPFSCASNEGYWIEVQYADNWGMPVQPRCYCFAPYILGSSFATIIEFKQVSVPACGGDVIRTVYYDPLGQKKEFDFRPCWGTLTFDADYVKIPDVLQASAMEHSDQWEQDFREIGAGELEEDAVSPFYAGEKGIWRPIRDHYYKDDRFQTSVTGNPEPLLATDGVFEGTSTDRMFYPFVWHPTLELPRHERWIPNQTITKYSPFGFELENRDILGVYSGALYGYDHSLTIAVASNARNRAIFFESFDDPSSPQAAFPTSTERAHTGRNSFKIDGSSPNWFPADVRVSRDDVVVVSGWVSLELDSVPYTYVATDDPETKSPGIALVFFDAANRQLAPAQFTIPAGEVIEGWQRIEGEYVVPERAAAAKVVCFEGKQPPGYQSPAVAYFDDIRVMPKDSNLRTFVYDPATFRLSAVLDNNNYATIYEYDEQGNVFLVKKETTEGIKTTQESISHQRER